MAASTQRNHHHVRPAVPRLRRFDGRCSQRNRHHRHSPPDPSAWARGCRSRSSRPGPRAATLTSQVFDHTSVIQFIEKRFGVTETNISPWRRAVAGDPTSVFQHIGNPNDQFRPAAWHRWLSALGGRAPQEEAAPTMPSLGTSHRRRTGAGKRCPPGASPCPASWMFMHP